MGMVCLATPFGFAGCFLLVGAASVDSVRLATPFGFAGVFLLVGAASVDSVRLATPFGFAGVFLLVGAASVDSVRLATPFGFAAVFLAALSAPAASRWLLVSSPGAAAEPFIVDASSDIPILTLRTVLEGCCP